MTPSGAVGTVEVDLTADLNAMDEDGYGWSLLSDARDPARIVVGRALFEILPERVSKLRHLLDLGTP